MSDSTLPGTSATPQDIPRPIVGAPCDGNPPTQDAGNGQPAMFLQFLINSVLSDPRTKAQIGSVIRGVLIAFGASWASTHAQGIDLAAGILIAVATAAWGIYQKYRVDRKIGRLENDASHANLRAVVAEIKEETMREKIQKGPMP